MGIIQTPKPVWEIFETMISPRKTVTLADVARAANVSKTTASHALSGKGYVSSATRESVLRLADEMGFSVDPIARLLSNGRCENTVGLYTLDLDLSQRTRQLQLIQAQLNDMGYSVPIYAYGYRGRDDLSVQMELVSGLIAQRPAAIVCNMSGVRKEVFEPLRRFQADGGIVICYGYGYGEFAPIECDQIIYAEPESFACAARYLLELGHREIGLFSVGHRKPQGAMLESVRDAMREFGAPLRDEWLFENDGLLRYEEDGHRLANHFLTLEKRPSAVIVANDYCAAAFVATLTRAGVRVPQELSVVGHDNDAIAPYAVVPLTTVSAPVEEIAEKVIEMLQSHVLRNYSGAPRKILLRGEIIQRQSCAPKN